MLAYTHPLRAGYNLKQVMDEVLMEMKHKDTNGSHIDISEVHLRAHEILYEKTYRQKPPSLSKCFEVLVRKSPRADCARLLPIESYFPKCRWSPDTKGHFDDFTELMDSSDEYAFFEFSLFSYIRENPVELRRTLPLLQDAWYAVFQRIRSAQARFLAARRAMFATKEITPEWYTSTEDRIGQLHKFSIAAHSVQFVQVPCDPSEMGGEVLRNITSMSQEEFQKFEKMQKKSYTDLILELS